MQMIEVAVGGEQRHLRTFCYGGNPDVVFVNWPANSVAQIIPFAVGIENRWPVRSPTARRRP
jgi:hypothetical protein